MEGGKVFVELGWRDVSGEDVLKRSLLPVYTSRASMDLGKNSAEGTFGEVKYCRHADEAIERACFEEPAFPGMKSTGTPWSCITTRK